MPTIISILETFNNLLKEEDNFYKNIFIRFLN